MILRWSVFGLFCAFLHTIGDTANCSIQNQDSANRQGRMEFQQKVNSKLDLLLDLLAKDGPYADLLLGMPGPKGQPGIQGPPGPQGPPAPSANLNQVATRVGSTEKILKKLHPEELRNHIFYGTKGGGFQIYSEDFNDVLTFVPSTKNLEGVAWDDENQKLYCCSHSKIYRVNRDGTGAHTAFSSTSYGDLVGLALDWISGNVYAVTWDGYIIACNPRITGQLKCSAIVTDQGSPNGIAMNPNHGVMYFTTYAGYIQAADMDGYNNYKLVSDLMYPTGIAVDFNQHPSKLFWVEYKGDVLRYCDLDGSNVQTVLQLPSGSYPWGLTILKDRLYWGQYWAYSIHSSSENGGDIRLLHTGNHKVKHFTAAAPNPNRTRENHCEGKRFSGICVLNRSSYSCRP